MEDPILDPVVNKGRSPEATPNPRQRHQRGVYQHPGTGRILIATTVPAADAFALQGWKFLRAATKEDLQPKPAQPVAPSQTAAPSADSKDLEKRLADAEAAQKAAEEKAESEAKARKEAEAAADKAKSDAEAAQKMAEEAEAKVKAAASQNSNPNGGKEGK